MQERFLKREQILPISLKKAWEFFSNPYNLSKITPSSMDIKIVSAVPEEIYEGLSIKYQVKPLWGIPMPWVSQIKKVRPPFQFVDIQVKGPYKYWYHHHYFQEVQGGVLVRDTITYKVHLDSFCPWIHDAIVIKELEKIFDFRACVLEDLFAKRVQYER